MMYDQDNIEVYHTPAEARHLKEVLAQIPEGNLIEVGVYMGGSAKIMAQDYPNRTIYAHDTFEGLPDDISVPDGDSPKYFPGLMKESSYEVVKANLKACSNIKIIKGRFPDTAIPNLKFAFAHIDVDTYKGTKETIEYLYPQICLGGLLLVHDYPAHPGVKKAIDEFMKEKTDIQEILGKEGRQLLIRKNGTS